MPGLSRGTTGDTAATLALLSSGVSGGSVSDLEAPVLALDFSKGTLAAAINSIFNPAPSFTRATTATVTDHENVVRNALSGEARFQGLRRVQNYISFLTEGNLAAIGWGATNGGTGSVPTYTPNFAMAPDGTQTAHRVQLALNGGGSSAANVSCFGASTPAINAVLNSCWLRTNDGTTKVITLRISAYTPGTDTVTVGPTWQRLSTRQSVGTGLGSNIFCVGLRGDAGSTCSDSADILFWHPQCEDPTGQSVQVPSEYVSVGALAAPYHGAGADAVQYFPYSNGNVVRQNLWARSQELDNAAWSPVNSTTSGNSLTAPDGTLTACKVTESLDGAPLSHILVSPAWTSALNRYTFSVYAKAGERQRIQLGISSSMLTGTGANARFTLTGDGLAENLNNCDTVMITSVGNGWYRCSMTFTPTAIALVGSFIYLSNSVGLSNYIGDGVSGAYVWGAQLQSGARVGTYVPTTSVAINTNVIEESEGRQIASATRAGYLSEGSRTNITIQSEDLSTSWALTRATVTANSTAAPNGTATADSLIEDVTAGNTHFVTQSVAKAASSLAYTLSVYAKASTRSAFRLMIAGDTGAVNGVKVDVDLSNGTLSGSAAVGAGWTLTGSTITSLPNGWYRISITGTSDTTLLLATFIFLENPVGTVVYNGDGASGIFLWGVQVEQATFASSYIPTTTAAVVRNADVLRYDTITGFFNAAEGTVVAEFVPFTNLVVGGVFAFNDGSSNNRIDHRNAASQADSIVSTGGVAQAVLSSPTAYTAGTRAKAALGYAANDFAHSINGAPVVTDVAGTVPAVTRLMIGDIDVGTSNSLMGAVRSLTYYNRRIPNAQLPGLST